MRPPPRAQRCGGARVSAPAAAKAASSVRPAPAGCLASPTTGRRHRTSSRHGGSVVAHAAASIAAGGGEDSAAAAARILQPYVAAASRPDALSQRSISHARSLPQLLELLQAAAATATADSLTSVLRHASLLTKAAHSSPSSRQGNTAAADAAAAQQLVSLALRLLLGLSDQVGGWQLSNCLLSLAVLCGRGGPAAAAMAGAGDGAAVAAGARAGQQQQQQPLPPSSSSGMLAQLVLGSASSVRDLETLLHATGPQHQLQALLEACRTTAVASAQPHQLVNVTYSLAVLLTRPAPAVLSALLWGLQEQLEAAAAQPGLFSPKQLSQLLWAAATLQLPLSPGWLQRYWAASQPLLAQHGAQDVANTTWALARLKQQQQQEEQQYQADGGSSSSHMAAQQRQQCQPPPAWLSDLQQQVAAVADSLTAQGVANTLWGLAVLGARVEPGLLVRLLQRGLAVGDRLQPQPLANLVWGATRCLCSDPRGSPQPTRAATAAQCRQLQEAILAQCAPRLGRQLLPIDWCNIMWAAGQARLHPSPALLAALWHKTPAGFSTSLNPHQPGGSGGSSRGAPSPARWCPQALAVTLWGCARLGIRPPPVWLRGFEVAAVPLLAGFSHQQLANTLWGFGELRVAPSDAWLLLFWRQADGIAARLAAAAAAAGAAGQATPRTRAGLLHSLQHAVMLLQACGRLQLLPPAGWMDQVLPALPVAAAALVGSNDSSEQHQEQEHRVLRTLSAAVQVLGSMARLQQREQDRVVMQQAAGSQGAAAAVAGQQLLQLMGLLRATRTATSGSSEPLAGLQGPDALLLLTALPRLQLEPQSQLLPAAGELLPVVHRSLQHLSSSEAAQVAAAVAGITHNCCRGGGSSSRSPHAAAPAQALWVPLAACLQQEEGQPHASSAAAAAGVFLDDLVRVLTRHVGGMTPSDLSASLAAVAGLSQAAAGSSSRQLAAAGSVKLMAPAAAAAVSSFVAAAGNAVGTHMQRLSPYQRSLAAASLAQLGLRPSPAWLQHLLRHSAWELGASSNGALLRLLQALPVLLQQLPAPHSQQHQQLLLMVRGWLADWCRETEPQLEVFSSTQLAAAAKSLAQLDRQLSAATTYAAASPSAAEAGTGHQLQRHSRQQRLQVPRAWAAQLLHTCAGRLQQLPPGELLALLGAAKSLRLEPGHDWCAAVAAEGAARAAAELAQLSGAHHQQQQEQRQGLRVHHVGLLAHGLRRLGYIPAWQHQAVLLQFAAAACDVAGGEHAAAAVSLRHQRVVAPRQLWQLLVLLALCSWRPERAWVQRVQQSAAGRRLRAWLGQRPQRDSWEQVWGRLVVWEDVPGRRAAQREQRARLAAVLADERRRRGDRGAAAAR